jgi:hypothetical protein
VHIHCFFFGREQVEQQRREASSVERAGDELIARAVAAAAAAVHEENDGPSAFWRYETAVQCDLSRRDFDFSFHPCRPTTKLALGILFFKFTSIRTSSTA